MKIRTAFISNSSSSTIVVDMKGLSAVQLLAIRDHTEYAKTHFPGWFANEYDDPWRIEEFPDMIILSTWMDNFDMYTFLSKIGVDEAYISKS